MVAGLNGASYVDKMRDAKTFTESSDNIVIDREVDRVYSTPTKQGASLPPITLMESGQPSLICTRDSLPDCTVWNGWIDKLKAMGDFEPKDGYKRYICIEPGAVNDWIKLEAGDAWEGAAIFEAKL